MAPNKTSSANDRKTSIS